MARLSQDAVRAIKKVVSKCERPGCGNKTNLHLHHVDKDPEHNVQSNLIVLCGDCHHGHAHVGPLSSTQQKAIVRKRSKKKKEDIQTILRKAKGRRETDEWGLGPGIFG